MVVLFPSVFRFAVWGLTSRAGQCASCPNGPRRALAFAARKIVARWVGIRSGAVLIVRLAGTLPRRAVDFLVVGVRVAPAAIVSRPRENRTTCGSIFEIGCVPQRVQGKFIEAALLGYWAYTIETVMHCPRGFVVALAATLRAVCLVRRVVHSLGSE